MERRGRRRRGERNADVEWDGCRQELLVLMRGGRHRVEKGGVVGHSAASALHWETGRKSCREMPRLT